MHILEDFGLGLGDLFGATSDGGADVTKMLAKRLGLQREWCIAHMVHAATKAACGLNDGISQNPNLSALVSRMNKTISQVKTVELSGDLFAALCGSMTVGKSTQLLDYAPQRFLSLTNSIRRILDKWTALKAWYEARIDQAIRRGKTPPSFPHEQDYDTLTQLLSLLTPIHDIKRTSQAESANQVAVLLALYRLRLNVLKADAPLKDYRSTRDNVIWIQPTQLTSLVAETRELLRKALDERFFSRYINREKRHTSPFVFEMQQRLHPSFRSPEKSLHRVVRLCCRENGTSMGEGHRAAKEISTIVHTKIRDLMLQIEAPAHSEDEESKDESQGSTDELIEEFVVPRLQRSPVDRVNAAVDDELLRWENDGHALRRIGDRREGVLEFWKRIEDTGVFRILPKIVRILYAVPASSAQIERDFGICGQMIWNQRGSLLGSSVDMCSFLKRNQDFVDITQCEVIADKDLDDLIPKASTFVLEDIPDDVEGDEEITELFSQASVDEM